MAIEFVVCLCKDPSSDISGEDDYPYPQAWFNTVALSVAASEQLAKELPHGSI